MRKEFQEVLTPIDGMALFYGEYRGRSMGRCIHYLWSICPNLADNVIFGEANTVKLWGKEFATINWDKGYPYFTFTKGYEYFQQKQEQLLNQK